MRRLVVTRLLKQDKQLMAELGAAFLGRDERHAWVRWDDPPSAEQLAAAWDVIEAVCAPRTQVGAFR